MRYREIAVESLIVLCRPGFEGDCAAELAARDLAGGYARTEPDSGWLRWFSADVSALTRTPLIFPRSLFRVQADFGDLPAEDRLTPLLALLAAEAPVGTLRLEYPDTNDGRGMERFLKRFRGPLERALASRGMLRSGAPDTLHLFFLTSSTGLIGRSSPGETSLWEAGIPRLRMPAAAPSRSALKLEEAWSRLLTPAERQHWLRDGRTGADLGAAPGGWTWQLARHGVRMTAVDHGKLQATLMDEYPVTHVRADAFTWRPPKTLDWLVCDIVDKPARSLALMELWLTRGWCRVAIFNLKLPMKQRYATVASLLDKLEQSLASSKGRWTVRAAQLYHDREEITVSVVPAS
jgi:23S rRNA (cytidine2498-2'-O)-methyltransferase